MLLVVIWNSSEYFTLDQRLSISILKTGEPMYHGLWLKLGLSHKFKRSSWAPRAVVCILSSKISSGILTNNHKTDAPFTPLDERFSFIEVSTSSK